VGLELTKCSIFGEDCLEFCHCFYLEVGSKVELKRKEIETIPNFPDVVDVSFAISVNPGSGVKFWRGSTVAGTSMTHPALLDELLQRHLINSILEFSTTTTPTPSEPHATMPLLDKKTKYPIGSWLRAVESPERTSSDYSH
jgi:hypothetical protein